MGDREMEEEEEEEEEMDLHCPPLYPLPEEIEQMERSEKVCRYCGVSYLILHEFHMLQTRLTQLEAELQEQREAAQREKTRREALELGRRECERALRLELQRRAEEKERGTREEEEKRREELERTQREAFEWKHEGERRAMEEEFERRSEERERELRERGERVAERARKQREEVERRCEEREKALGDALQKANENSEEQRKYLQQLEERLAMAASEKEQAERLLGKDREQCQVLRGVCARQQQALGETLSLLRSSGRELGDIRGFLTNLAGAWQVCRTQLLQHSAQVFSEMEEELKHSSVEFQRLKAERDHLAQQLTEERSQRDRLQSQQTHCEREHRKTLLGIRKELKETEERWSSCLLRCDSLQGQLSAWQQREEQLTRKCSVAEEEVTSLRRALEKAEHETRELSRERDCMAVSHGRAVAKIEEDFRQELASKLAAALEDQRAQNTLRLREQREEHLREAELESVIDREKNQLLLQRYQRESTQLQRKLQEREEEVRGLREELQQERRSREEERKSREEEKRRREEERYQVLQHAQQQEALQLSQTKAELQQLIEQNTALQEEVSLLQETVRRECEERGELTAALTQAREQLFGQRAPASPLASSGPPLPHTPRQTHPTPEQGAPQPPRIPLTRSLTPQNTLRPSSPHSSDRGAGWGRDGGGGGKRVVLGNGTGGRGGETGRGGTLPKLNEVKRKVSLVMGRRDRL